MKNLVYATTNPGKFEEARQIFAHHGLTLHFPLDLGVSLEVEETGNTLEENAKLKAESGLAALPEYFVISDDTGLEIEALGGEPGIKVRRWKGYSMSDEEIINYTLARLEGVPPAKRIAQFHTVLAVAVQGQPIRYFHGRFKGRILEKPKAQRVKGMPYFPLFYLDQLGLTLGEFHELPINEQLKTPTHRELAALAALPYLNSLLD